MKNSAEKYKQAYTAIFNKLPKWKQNAIEESRKSKRQDDSIYNEFIKAVIELAEKE